MADTISDPVNDRLAQWYPVYDSGPLADPHDLSFLDDPPIDSYQVQASRNTNIQLADSSLGSAEDSGVSGLPSTPPPVYPTALAVMNRNLYMGGIQPYVHFDEQDTDPDDDGFAADLFEADPNDSGLIVDDDAEGEDDDGKYEILAIYRSEDQNASQEQPSRQLESVFDSNVELSDSGCSDVGNDDWDDACAENNEGRADNDCEASMLTSHDLNALGKPGVYEDADDSDDSDDENCKVYRKGRTVDAKHDDMACIHADGEEHVKDSSDEEDSGKESSDEENKEHFTYSKPTHHRVVNVHQHPLEPSKLSGGKRLDDEIAGAHKPCPYSLRNKAGPRPRVLMGESLGDRHAEMKQPNRTKRQCLALTKEVPAVPDTTSRKVVPACSRTLSLARQELNDNAHQMRALINSSSNPNVPTPSLAHALVSRFPNIAPTVLGKREREDEGADQSDESGEENEDDYTPQARPTGSRSTQRRASKVVQYPLAPKEVAREAHRAKDIVDVEKKSRYTLRHTTVAQTRTSTSESSGRYTVAEMQPVQAKRQRLSADDDDDYNEEEEEEALCKKTGRKNPTKAMKPCLWENCQFSAPSTERHRHMMKCHFKDHELRWICAGSECTAEFRRLDELPRHCKASPSCLESGTWKRKTTLRSKREIILYNAQMTGNPPWSKKEILEHLRLPPEGPTGQLENEIAHWRQKLRAKPWPSLRK